MDVSLEYVQMCEKAVEIQALVKYTDGNWFFYKGENLYNLKFATIFSIGLLVADLDDLKLAIFDGYDGRESALRVDFIWLPRQDQLQEMIYSNERVFAKLERLGNWWIKPENKVGYCESMEQLWLAFVMKEKYQKTWNKNDWINE